MAEANGNIVLGAGQLLFERFPEGVKLGTGAFRYLGNTPGFSTSQSEETLDHFDADMGTRAKDFSATLSTDVTASITCDNISAENLALWYRGVVLQQTVAQAANQEEEFEGIALGGVFVLGMSPELPTGAGHVSAVSVESGAETITAAGNWSIDEDAGVLTILPDAIDLEEGDNITVKYTQDAATFPLIVGRADTAYGALFYKDNATTGTRRDGFFPYVKISPDGDYDLKSDDWQTMTFNVEILKRDPATERVYWKTR